MNTRYDAVNTNKKMCTARTSTQLCLSNFLPDEDIIILQVSGISWSPDGGNSLAVAYCDPDFLGELSTLVI